MCIKSGSHPDLQFMLPLVFLEDLSLGSSYIIPGASALCLWASLVGDWTSKIIKLILRIQFNITVLT